MKKEKIINLIILFLLIAVVGSSFYFYSVLPDKVITHWNFAGEADGWSSKNFYVIFFPALIIFMWLLFKFLPKIDPRAKGYHDFKSAYLAMQLIFMVFFSLVYLISTLVNLNYDISISWMIMTLIGLMFMALGLCMPQLKPNWFVGIKTPWTLSNDYVWQKTHQFGGIMFFIAGLIFIIMPYWPESWYFYMFILSMFLILSTIVYSYYIFHKQKRTNNGIDSEKKL